MMKNRNFDKYIVVFVLVLISVNVLSSPINSSRGIDKIPDDKGMK